MKKFGMVIMGIFGVILMIALAFALELGGLKWKEFFAPKHADVERKTFKRTRSFNEAKTQELARYKREWEQAGMESQADPEAKAIVAATVRTTFADYDETLLPQGLRYWLIEIRGY
jgi:hypothetical protein